jgi:hypothetical protein
MGSDYKDQRSVNNDNLFLAVVEYYTVCLFSHNAKLVGRPLLAIEEYNNTDNDLD